MLLVISVLISYPSSAWQLLTVCGPLSLAPNVGQNAMRVI